MITAVIMSYNRDKYLAQCIESFLPQKFLSDIIVVDDCSTDNSKAIAEKYNTKWFQTAKNNGDPAESFNIGIKKVKTKYFYIIAGDDWVEDDCFETLCPNMAGKDYLSSSIYVTDEAGKVCETWNNHRKTPAEIVHHVFNTGGSGAMSTVGLYRTSFMKKVGYIKVNNIESDTLNVLNYLKNGLRYDIISKPLSFYRQHKENRSKNILNRVQKTIEILNFIHEYFNEEDYAPQYYWDKISNRKEFKEFLMARAYINIFNSYSANFIPPYLKNTLTQKEIAEITKPFLLQANNFLKKARQSGNEFTAVEKAGLSEVQTLLGTFTE